MQPAGLPGNAPRRPNVVLRYLSRFDDGQLTRAVFFGLLAGSIGVLALDLFDLAEKNGWWAGQKAVSATQLEPILPPFIQTDAPMPSDDPRRLVTADETLLGQPMSFTLGAGGVLAAEGSIDQGASARLAAELEARGEYVKVVSLNSPGGSLDDAMKMAKMIRERELATEVLDGALCASSCPLVLAGGEIRTVAPSAAVGVHQFYAAAREDAAPQQVMADAQMITARISRHLIDMGVDPALWLHALDTPPQALYYLSAAEMMQYRLVNAPIRTAQTQ
ncbi:MAG: hypothetical protein KF810_18850 [Rhizobiaceae bacterium]|nr:hypothetical protein [Rhizobiaceae bacterium]